MKGIKSPAKTFLSIFQWIDAFIGTLEGWAVCILLVELIVISFLQVLLRNIFATSIAWGDEILKISMLWIGLIGTSLAIRQGRHINIDVMSHILPSRYKLVIQLVLDLVLAFVCFIFLFASIHFIEVQRQFGEKSGIWETPMWILYLIFPVLFGVGVFRLTIKTVENAIAIPGGWKK